MINYLRTPGVADHWGILDLLVYEVRCETPGLIFTLLSYIKRKVLAKWPSINELA